MLSGTMRLATAIFVAAALSLSAAAASDAVFVVQRVAVQADGDSAAAARSIAQMQGRRRAMDVLLRRMTVSSDWTYLPHLAAGEPASALPAAEPGQKSPVVLDDSTLINLESGFEVYDEKASATTYRATITYRFKPDAVRRLLRNAAIPYSETQTLPALVLPVLETANGVYLWESNNPWLGAWRGRAFSNELTPIRLPVGNGADIAAISARQALLLDPAAVEALAKNYGVAQVIVAHARLQRNGDSDRLSVRLVNAYRDTAAAAIPQDGAEEQGVDSATLAALAAEPAQSSAKVGDVLASGVFSGPSGQFTPLAAQAIDETISDYAAAWKAKTLIDQSREAAVETTAFFQSVEDWARIRAGLNATPLVGGVQVFALSSRGAELRLKMFGDPSRLAVALDAYGVVFWTEDGAHWLLATPSEAAALKGDKSLRVRRVDFGPANSDKNAIQPATDYRDPDLAPDSKIDQIAKSPN